MIHRKETFRTEIRHEMRGGVGDVKIEHLYDEAQELSGNARLFAILNLEPGCSIGFHRHETEDEILTVLQGTAEMDDNGTTVTLHAGDTLLTGHGAGHSVKNVGKDLLRLHAVILPYHTGGC